MATYKYYIEPTSFDRGFTKATSHVAEWNNVLIDLGEIADGVHQCYSIVDAHVEAKKGYLETCSEISIENYLDIVRGHGNVPEQYLIVDVMTMILNKLDEGESTYIEVWDSLPASVDTLTEPHTLILDEVNMETLASRLGHSTLEMMEVVIGFNSAYPIPSYVLEGLAYKQNG